MNKKQAVLLIVSLVFIFVLVYSPHFSYKFPYHIDEWHHVAESTRLNEGNYTGGLFSLEIGFHIFLSVLSKLFGLISIYHLLPAVFAVISASVLFLITRKLTNNFYISLFAIIFLASIKSNVNIIGFWFFTPLTFAIPLIFCYMYFFSQGIEKENKNYLMASFFIMIILLFTHALSVLFAVPALLIFLVIRYKKARQQLRFLSIFLLIPIIGALFYKFAMGVSFSKLFYSLLGLILFKQGWGVLELKISFLLIYSLMGFVLAFFGLVYIIRTHQIEKYLIYILWTITTLMLIFFFYLTKISIFAPYQRNLYYFAISLPLFSAMGLYYLVVKINNFLEKQNIEKTMRMILVALLIVGVLFLTFYNYYSIPKQIELYRAIDNEDYEALMFLSEKNVNSRILTTQFIGTATYAISQKNPLASIYFYGNPKEKQDTRRFFTDINCDEKSKILQKYNIKYVLSKKKLNCNWQEIYNKGDYIYRT